jgi:leucyl aminopeptidase (aminopeptidase T)
MGLGAGESALIVVDEPMRELGQALWSAARSISANVLMVEMPPGKSNGEEPPAEVAALMKRYSVVLCPTSKSLTHTDARREACAAGARVGTLPNVSPEIMVRCMNADYAAIAARTRKLCEMMERTSEIRVSSPAGTDLRLPMKGRKAHASTGLIRKPGEWGNLPTGEAYLAPLEGRSEGTLVVDGSMATIGMLATPIRIVVKGGFAEGITGGREADSFRALLEPHGRDARNVAEFGIGTNDKAILSGRIIEDEKVMGTIHVAFGDNVSMGGHVRVSSHLDGLVKSPSVWFDGKQIMEKGSFVIEF